MVQHLEFLEYRRPKKTVKYKPKEYKDVSDDITQCGATNHKEICQQFVRYGWALDVCIRIFAYATKYYRRDWLVGTCIYRLQQQENMRLLYVCTY